MASTAHEEAYVPPEEYLAREREADFKSEYLNGRIYAMSGSSPEHSAITVSLTIAVGSQLRGKPCQAFSKDMKVRTTPAGLYAYPDLTVVCGEPRFHDEHRDVLINPTVNFEVLSPSAEAYDRGKKFIQCQGIRSLTDYVMIAQDEPRIEHYARQAEGQWLLTAASGLESTLVLASIGCTILLSEVYERVAFPSSPGGE